MKAMKSVLAAGVVALVLGGASGCASKPQPLTVVVDPAVAQLSEAANEIAYAYRVLSYAESARLSADGSAVPVAYSLDDFPPAWRARYALEDDYFGELEPFVRGLARLVGYDEPQILGPRPVIPVAVAVNRANKPLADFLVDVSYQAGARAKVVLDAGAERLQIVYPQ